MSTSQRVLAALGLVVAALGWALTPVFVRFLSFAYDHLTLAFFRYSSAAVVLAIICLVWFRRDVRNVFRSHKGVLALAVVNVTMMYTWMLGIYNSTATKAQFITKLSIVFVIILSYFIFREERAVITSRTYLFGTLLSLLGVTALIADNPGSLVPSLDKATLLLLATSVLWAVYTVLGRHVVINCHPVAMFTVVAVYTSIGLGILCFALGEPGRILEATPRTIMITVISGLVPIGIAHPFFLFAQKHLGSALCSSLLLFNPLITYAIAMFLWSDEHLMLMQWVGAAALLAGTSLVTYAGHWTAVRSAA